VALADSLTIQGAASTSGSGSPLTYALTKRDNGGTERVDTASTLFTPNLLIVRHSVQGVEKGGGIVTDRHLFSVVKTIRDANNVAYKGVFNLTAAIPRNAGFTQAELRAEIWRLTNFFSGSTNIDAFLRGES
jgi:hypothetical protein